MKNVKRSMKPIPKSMRGKKRYVLFELVSDERFDEEEVKKALWKTILQLFGELGAAKQKFWFVKWSKPKQRGIVRCALEHTDEVKTGLLFLKEISGKSVVPRTLLTSGNIKKLKEKL